MSWITSFEFRIVLLLTTGLIALFIDIFAIVRYLALIGKLPQVRLPNFLHSHIFSLVIVGINLGLFAVLGLVGARTYFVKPEVVQTYPDLNTYFSDAAQTITIEFNVPVNQKDLQFNLSPDIPGRWEWQSGPLGKALSQKVIFYPEESFYPGSRIVIYMVGLHPAWYPWASHEQALGFEAPKIPSVTDTTPTDGSDRAPITQPISIAFDAPVGDFVDIQYEVIPNPGAFQVQKDQQTHKLIWDTPLEQDQHYQVNVYRTPRSYRVDNHEDIERGETEMIKSFSFDTVSTPLIASYEPRGGGVLTNRTLQVVFDQEMNHDSVVEHFSIQPAIDGQTSWLDDKTFVFAPNQPLAKDTTYTVVFSPGIVSNLGGNTTDEIKYTFTTVGRVDVTGVSPRNGSSGVDPSNTNVQIDFNQNVDHESAQSHLQLSPNTGANVTWQNNSMIVETAGKLSYSTTYRVTLTSGIKSIDGLDSDKDISFQFSTRDQSFSLNVPYYSQTEQFSCNLAATRMALGYRGVGITESSMKNALGIGQNPDAQWVSGYGVHVGPVSNFVNQYRSSGVKRNWNTVDLVKEVQNGNPVIVWVYNRYSQPAGAFTLSGGYTGYNGMHSEVVRGFVGDPNNPAYILTNDPWRGQLKYSRAQFESIWSYLGNTALVVN